MEINVATETFLRGTSKLAAALVSRVSLEAAHIDPKAKTRGSVQGLLHVAAGAVRRISIRVAFFCNQELITLVTLSLSLALKSR